MKKEQNLSTAELEIMQILWNSDTPMRVQDVCDMPGCEKWKYKTVATLLLRMEEKGAVKSQKVNKANLYTPILNKEQYTKSQTDSFIEKLYGGSAKELTVSLFKNEALTKDDIEEIRRMFEL